MKKILAGLILRILGIISLFPVGLQAQWLPMNGPGGADNITCFAKSAKAIFIAIDMHGASRSMDNGDHWSPMNICGQQYIDKLYTRESTVFAFSSGHIFRSVDNGLTWAETPATLGSEIYVSSIASNADYLFISTPDHGIFRSSDNGDTWSAIGKVIETRATPIAVMGNTVVIGGTENVGDGSNHKMYRSTDNGLSWIASDSGLPDGICIYRLTAIGSRIFATTNMTDIFVSADSGKSWAAINSTVIDNNATAHTFSADDICLVGDGNLLVRASLPSSTVFFISTNSGSDWTAVNLNLPFTEFTNYMVNGKYIFVGSRGSGIFRSTDLGVSWSPVNTGITYTTVSCFAESGQSMFAGTLGAGVFVSKDSGMNWSPANAGLTDRTIFDIAIQDTFIFATNYKRGISRSTINDMHWINVDSDSAIINSRHLAVFDGIVFASAINGVFRSTDHGAHWIAANSGLQDSSTIQAFTVCDSTLFAGCRGGLYYYNKAGNQWNMVPSSPVHDSISSLAGNGTVIYMGTESKGLYISENKGLDWHSSPLHYCYLEPTSFGFSTTKKLPVSSISTSGTNVCVGLPGPSSLFNFIGGCYFSADTGRSWSYVGPDTSYHMSSGVVCIKGTNIFVGPSEHGIWRESIPGMTGAKKNVRLTSGLTQKPDFVIQEPSRAHPAVIVGFGLSCSKRVAVSIYDLSGKRVALLVDGRLDPGTYRFRWNCGSQTPGLYTVRVMSGAKLFSKAIPIVQ
ncbi:MAG: hypothetical protein Q8935_00135 [Bacillota bacterium]|nr:hypothetical protein [Bacillota bacterium]